VVPAGHNYILILKIHQKAPTTWCDGHRLTVSKYEPENQKNLSASPLRFSMRFIQHPIGLEHHPRNCGRSEQQVGSPAKRAARLPSLLYLSTLKCHVIC